MTSALTRQSTLPPTVPGTPTSPARRRCPCAWPTPLARSSKGSTASPGSRRTGRSRGATRPSPPPWPTSTRFGERFRENAASRAIRADGPANPDHANAILAFDPLDHPATADDVAQGRAIFSLDGAGAEVRRVALPSCPIDARWTKLEVLPDEFHLQRIFDGEGHGRPDIDGLQTGRVWQAEEVREGERPGRYRLEIRFDDLKAADGSQSMVATLFRVVSRAKK